ncbi:MAG TPA: GntR family transcriptional regulator [Noviherbaspirillum sp.]|jgi:DNA-binding GntR family transcriptional regulator|uniref:GntR family transcriptional regulator n=1 Tax=Noviherbaspirillum sp. TaxID=1926288 RepID=UPI002F91F075
MTAKATTTHRKVVRPKSLTDLAVDMIRAEIVEGRLQLGEQLSESQLANDLGISKTPVREALFQLKLQGLVEVHPQRGTFVFQLSEGDVHEICGFREVIECAALAKAMEDAREALADTLQGILDETAAVEKRGDFAQLPRLDAQFHEAFIAHAGSTYLNVSYNLISYKIQALRARLPEHDPDVDECGHNHALIVAEIKAGNTGAAQEILRLHIRDTERSYISASKKRNVLAA